MFLPKKVIKLNEHLFAKFFSRNFIPCVDIGDFPSEYKHVGIVPV